MSCSTRAESDSGERNAEMMQDPSATVPDVVREGYGTSGPERNWPANCWWVAAHASEVTEAPIMRWVLELPIAIYRGADGKVVALHNRCPHRWAPLSLGTVEANDLVCPYHGLRFAPSGQCVRVPTQDHTPGAIRVRSFPVEERYGFVWVWTGAVESADPALIPHELAFLADPSWQTVWGYKSVNGNYMQIKENVLDLTHFAFLHAKSLGITGWDSAPAVEVTERAVTFRKLFDRAPLPPVYALPAGKPPGKACNRDNWGSLLSPAVQLGGVDMHDPEPGAEGIERFSMRIIHLTTPVSIGRTHYFWAMARDHGAPYDFEKERAMADIVFGEDIAIVEATQDMARRSIDQEDAVEYSVAADRTAVEARRRVQALVEAERRNSEGVGT